MITVKLRQKNCTVIQAKGDADVDIVKAAVAMSYKKSTTLIGEDTDLLILLLYHGKIDSKELFFRSDKRNSHMYNIKTLKAYLGNDVCTSLLFAHAFSGCDTTSRIFSLGKKSVVFQEIIRSSSVLRSCSEIFCTPGKDQATVESAGCTAMVSLFNGSVSDSLSSLRYSYLCKKWLQQRHLSHQSDCHPQTRLQNITQGERISKSWNGWV